MTIVLALGARGKISYKNVPSKRKKYGNVGAARVTHHEYCFFVFTHHEY